MKPACRGEPFAQAYNNTFLVLICYALPDRGAKIQVFGRGEVARILTFKGFLETLFPTGIAGMRPWVVGLTRGACCSARDAPAAAGCRGPPAAASARRGAAGARRTSPRRRSPPVRPWKRGTLKRSAAARQTAGSTAMGSKAKRYLGQCLRVVALVEAPGHAGLDALGRAALVERDRRAARRPAPRPPRSRIPRWP